MSELMMQGLHNSVDALAKEGASGHAKGLVSGQVFANQVDPGHKDFAIFRLRLRGGRTILQALVTQQDGLGYAPLMEYWYACERAESELENAQALTLDHQGDYEWEDYDTVWVTEAPAGRSNDVAIIPALVEYKTPASYPTEVFEGAVEIEGEEITVRLVLKFQDNQLVQMSWYHNGDETVCYLVQNDTSMRLSRRSATWPGTWRCFSWQRCLV